MAISSHSYRVNDRIRIREVRLIDEDGSNLGVMATKDARDLATSKSLDLVEVAPDARPPVCRIMDYGKFMYEQAKKERAARKGQKQVEIKGIRIRPDTDSYHIGFKVRQARSFLLKGNKVRITCLFRGRERSHPEIARKTMEEIAAQLGDIATIEQHANFEGRSMTMVITPDPAAVEKYEKERKAARRAADALRVRSQGGAVAPRSDEELEAEELAAALADEEFDEDDLDDEEFDEADLDDDDLDDDDLDDDEEVEGAVVEVEDVAADGERDA